MLVQLASPKQEDRKGRKAKGANSFAYIAKEVATQSKGATKYMVIQVQTNKEVGRRHTEVPIVVPIDMREKKLVPQWHTWQV